MSEKILIVEDDALIAEDLKSTLLEYGYQIHGPIDNGEKAIEDILKINPSFVLMDINLNGSLDGIETAKKIQTLISVPIVFLTALNDESTLQRAKLANPYGYLIKPFDGAELRSTIETTLHRFKSEKVSSLSSDVEKSALFDYESISNLSSPEFIASSLKMIPLFSRVKIEAIEKLTSAASIRGVEAGQFVVFEGEEPQGCFIPISGRMSITKTSDSGKELIVALLAPGDSFGFFFSLPSFSKAASAKTQIDSKLIWIPMAAWRAFTSENPEIYHSLANELSERLCASHALSSSLAHARVEGRIIHTLLSLLPTFGKSTGKELEEGGRIFITRKELSELTGTTPETAIRVTKNLEREGLLDLSRAGIIKILSAQKLRNSLK